MRIGTIAVLVVSGVVALEAAGVDVPTGFDRSYNQALTRASKDNKPLFVYFAVDKSDLCRRFEQEILADAKNRQALEPLVAVCLDCSPGAEERNINRELLEKHGGAGYPFFLLLAPDGAVLDAWTGYASGKDFVPRILEARKKFDRYNEFQERAKTVEPDDFRFHLEAMDLYASTRQWVKMEVAAGEVIRLDRDRAYLSRVRLAQLQAARATKNARAVDGLVAEIRTLDPRNTEHHLEVALKEHADSLMLQMTTRTLDPQYKKAHAILVERAALENLCDPLQARVDIALLQANYGRYKDARLTLEILLAEHSDIAATAHLRPLLQRIRQMENRK